jgi:hypothetical protein
MKTGGILQISSFAWAVFLFGRHDHSLQRSTHASKIFKQSINYLEGERLEREPIPFITQVMHQNRLLASGEETIEFDKVVFLLAAHLVIQAAGGERF